VLANVAYALQDAEIGGRLKPAIRALLDDD